MKILINCQNYLLSCDLKAKNFREESAKVYMVYEGTDYIFYTNLSGSEVVLAVLKSVSEKWKQMEGFITDNFTDSDFICFPNESDLDKNWVGVFVYKNSEIRAEAKRLGVGVSEETDKNTFELFFQKLTGVKLEVIIRSRNEAFRNPELPGINYNIDPYEALIRCSEFYQITLTVFDEPANDETSAWLFNLVESACMGNLR